MGMLEKPRYRSFLQFIQEYNAEDSKSWDGFDASVETMKACYDKFGLDPNTADFTGHALALYLTDEYGHSFYFHQMIFRNCLKRCRNSISQLMEFF